MLHTENLFAADGQRLVQLAALSDSLDYIADAIGQSGEPRNNGNDLQVNMPKPSTQRLHLNDVGHQMIAMISAIWIALRKVLPRSRALCST